MWRFINLSHWNKRLHLTHTASLACSPSIQHPLWSNENSQLFKLDIIWRQIWAVSWHILYRDIKWAILGYNILIISPSAKQKFTERTLAPNEYCVSQPEGSSHSGAFLCGRDDRSFWLSRITQWSKEAYFDSVLLRLVILIDKCEVTEHASWFISGNTKTPQVLNLLPQHSFTLWQQCGLEWSVFFRLNTLESKPPTILAIL